MGPIFSNHPELTDTWWHRAQAHRAEQAANPVGAPIPLGGPYFSDVTNIVVRPRYKFETDWVTLDYLDHDSFRHIVDGFGVDRDGVRYFLPSLEEYGRPAIKGADPDTFKSLGDDWYRDAKSIYYLAMEAMRPTLVKVRADPDTFEVIGGVYARDANALFVEGVRKRDIEDLASVVPLGGVYARMGTTILRNGKPVKSPGKIGIETARGFPHIRMLMDARGQTLLGGRFRKAIPDLDVPSFRFLNDAFAVDAHRVYVLTEMKFTIDLVRLSRAY